MSGGLEAGIHKVHQLKQCLKGQAALCRTQERQAGSDQLWSDEGTAAQPSISQRAFRRALVPRMLYKNRLIIYNLGSLFGKSIA